LVILDPIPAPNGQDYEVMITQQSEPDNPEPY
jgi:hypothetical protein